MRESGGVGEGESPASFNMAERNWTLRPGVEERVRVKLERSVPNEQTRRAALALLAFAIENADEERPGAWYVRETSNGFVLITGRLIACKVTRSKVRLSVVGPVADEVRTVLGADPEDDGEFKKIPGGLLLTFPVEHAGEALRLLEDGLNSFVDLAMARVRRAISLEDHVPEAVAYVASVVGRKLPQPEPGAEVAETEPLDDPRTTTAALRVSRASAGGRRFSITATAR